MSLRDVCRIINKHIGDNKKKELTTEHKAIISFNKGMKPTDVALKLRITLEEACRLYHKYEDALYLGKFGEEYSNIRGYVKELTEICYALRNGYLNIKQLVDEYHLARDLGEMEERHLYLMSSTQEFETRKSELESDVRELQNVVQSLEERKQGLLPEVEFLESRLSLTKEFLAYPNLNPQYNNLNQNPFPAQFPFYYQNQYRYW